MLKYYLFFGIGLLGYCMATAQVPNTDIFWCDIALRAKGKLSVGKPHNVTQREGYDNQPYFINDNEMLYVAMDSILPQSDIWWYGNNHKKHAITATDSTSEFSPMVSADGKKVSAVLIEKDGNTQRIWQYDLHNRNTEKNAQLWQATIAHIGYYCPISPDTMAIYVLGDSPTLQIISASDTIGHIVAGEIGRCLQHIPHSHQISFTQKTRQGKRLIKSLNLQTLDVISICPAISDSEDYVWLPNGCLMMGDGAAKLYLYNPKQPNKQWQLVANLLPEGIKKISRLAVSPTGKRLAIVAEK